MWKTFRRLLSSRIDSMAVKMTQEPLSIIDRLALMYCRPMPCSKMLITLKAPGMIKLQMRGHSFGALSSWSSLADSLPWRTSQLFGMGPSKSVCIWTD